MPKGNVTKILILRFSSLGDIVMATAMIRNVRKAYPRAQIDMVVREDFLDLIKHNPHIDQKIGLPRGSGLSGLRRLKSKLNRERYDLIYDAHRSLRTRFLMPLLDADDKCYYEKHYLTRSVALTFKVDLLKDSPRMLERYLEPLKPYGIEYDGGGPEVFIDKETERRALTKVVPPQSKSGQIIGVVPSAQWPGKRWPLPNFRELLKRIIDDSDHSIVIFGGKEDSFCTELVAGLPTHRVVNSQGKLSILESAALLKQCSLVVANDTGLMHVADALNIPNVLILGPTSRELGCLPFHPMTKVLEHKLWCRPCSKNGQAPCIRSQRYCLELTRPETVLKATLELLVQLKTGVPA